MGKDAAREGAASTRRTRCADHCHAAARRRQQHGGSAGPARAPAHHHHADLRQVPARTAQSASYKPVFEGAPTTGRTVTTPGLRFRSITGTTAVWAFDRHRPPADLLPIMSPMLTLAPNGVLGDHAREVRALRDRERVTRQAPGTGLGLWEDGNSPPALAICAGS